ncbi:hypothetical protein [Lentzea sp. NPDC051838]|uniref:hypothetical protein n=1 Tax=Lentzea sp. NPDC051838 TaxID=3154849 RepID=UPI0034356025
MTHVVGAAGPDWQVWLGLAALMALSGGLAVWFEYARRKTYSVVLDAARDGTLLLDVRPNGRLLLVVRPLGAASPAVGELPLGGVRERR